MSWTAVFVSIFACVWIAGLVVQRSRYPIAKLAMFFGVVGFFPLFILPGTKDLLNDFELPASFAEMVIRAPDGGKYTALVWSSRIQRYREDSSFSNGWFPKTLGGLWQIGLTHDGLVAVASIRGRHIELFNAEGERQGEPLKVADWPKSMDWSDTLNPGEITLDGLDLVQPGTAPPPRLTWLGVLLFPLWHVYFAVALILLSLPFFILEQLEHQIEDSDTGE